MTYYAAIRKPLSWETDGITFEADDDEKARDFIKDKKPLSLYNQTENRRLF